MGFLLNITKNSGTSYAKKVTRSNSVPNSMPTPAIQVPVGLNLQPKTSVVPIQPKTSFVPPTQPLRLLGHVQSAGNMGNNHRH